MCQEEQHKSFQAQQWVTEWNAAQASKKEHTKKLRALTHVILFRKRVVSHVNLGHYLKQSYREIIMLLVHIFYTLSRRAMTCGRKLDLDVVGSIPDPSQVLTARLTACKVFPLPLHPSRFHSFHMDQAGYVIASRTSRMVFHRHEYIIDIAKEIDCRDMFCFCKS